MLLGTVLVLLLLGGGPASAHAALRSADPADGSVVKTAPDSITLTFTESVGLLDDSFRVFDPDNQRLKTGKSEHADGRADTARITLPGKLGTGTFTVAWRVVSADSHPIAGAFTFSVGEPSAIPPALPSTSVENPATSGLFNIGRYVAYLAAALLIGTAAFVAVCRPPDIRPLRRLLLAGWWALTVSTVFLLLLRGPYETGAGPADVLDPSGLTRTLGTRPGLALVARLALLAAAAVLLLRQRGLLKERTAEQPSRPVLLTGAALAVGLALTWAAAEHASAGIQVPAAMTSSVLHLLSMAVWLGGLTALLTLLYRASVPGRVVNGFSRLAGWSVTVLVVTGVYQSWRGLGSVSALTDTTYGRVLLAKLAMVTLLLAAGARSRQTVTTATRGARGATETTEAREATEATEATERTTGNVAVETADEQKEARFPEPVGGRAAVSAAESSTGRAEGLVLPEKPSPEKPSPEKPSDEVPAVEKPPAKRSALTPAEDAHRRALRRSVLAEVAVSVVVLVLTTVLTGTLPGRAAAEAATAEQSAGLPVASVTNIPFEIDTPRVGTVSGKVQVTLDPGRVGDNGLQAVVYGPDGGFVSVPSCVCPSACPTRTSAPSTPRSPTRAATGAPPPSTSPSPAPGR